MIFFFRSAGFWFYFLFLGLSCFPPSDIFFLFSVLISYLPSLIFPFVFLFLFFLFSVPLSYLSPFTYFPFVRAPEKFQVTYCDRASSVVVRRP